MVEAAINAGREHRLDLVDSLTTAVLLLDRDLNVLTANAAAQALLSISTNRVKGRWLGHILPGADELVAAARRALLEGSSFSERGLDLRLSKEHTALVDCYISPLWHGGNEPLEILIEMSNVERHQRIQLEGHMLMQNNVTSTLLRGLAHEIKNPLGGIRGAAQLLERELEDQRQEEYTQIIIGEADRLRKLVDRMLGPREQTKTESINIHDILEHVRNVVRAERAGEAAVEVDYDPSLPNIEADRDQLIQAFLNLVRNALQAVNGSGGSVTVRTRIQRKFTIGGVLHRLVIRVQIIDTGPGVDPELGNSIFFPLVSGRAEGSGLGLPIAQTLIQRQGGLIGYESEPGHTEFSVWLPLGEDA